MKNPFLRGFSGSLFGGQNWQFFKLLGYVYKFFVLLFVNLAVATYKLDKSQSFLAARTSARVKKSENVVCVTSP